MNDLNDLTLIIRSRFPIVVVETHEESRFLELLERVASLEGQALFVWNIADCLRRRDRPRAPEARARSGPAAEPGSDSQFTLGVIPRTREFDAALDHICTTTQSGIYVLLDPHPFLADPFNLRRIKNAAQEYQQTPRTIVLVGGRLELPADLRRLAAHFSLVMPDGPAIRKLLKEEADACASGASALAGQPEAVEMMVQQLGGLCLEDARRVVRQCLRDDGVLNMQDMGKVLKAKQDMLDANSAVEIELEISRLTDVAGLENLKRWLAQRRAPFLGDAVSIGLDTPRGVLLLGVQGCGKSLTAKAVAGSWNVPLLRLDFAMLHNRWSGETERSLRGALRFADSMAPCVLWIDEIDKALAAGTSDGGQGLLLGSLLAWMEERESRVFMVATANDIERLPLGLMLKGRFDEIFFVDLPGVEARGETFSIHLERRRLDPVTFDIAKLAAATEGYSGAEIEQAIVSALYEARALQQPLATEHIYTEIERMRPLSSVMSQTVQGLRLWAVDRTVPAG